MIDIRHSTPMLISHLRSNGAVPRNAIKQAAEHVETLEKVIQKAKYWAQLRHPSRTQGIELLEIIYGEGWKVQEHPLTNAELADWCEQAKDDIPPDTEGTRETRLRLDLIAARLRESEGR